MNKKKKDVVLTSQTKKKKTIERPQLCILKRPTLCQCPMWSFGTFVHGTVLYLTMDMGHTDKW